MASMRKKKGRYYARFYNPNRWPERKEITLRTTRKDVARRRLHEMERAFERGEFDPWKPKSGPEPLAVEESIGRFMEAKSHLRASTRKNYETILRAWARDFCPPSLMLKALEASNLRPYVHAAGVSQAERRKRYRYLRVLLNWTVEAGLIQSSPLEDVRNPKPKKKQPAFLTTEDLQRLLRYIDAHKEMRAGMAGPQPDDDWLKDMIRVGVCTGLRRGELLALRWQDVDLENGFVHVRNRSRDADRFETKSGNERSVRLAGGGLDVFQRLRTSRKDGLDGPVFLDRDGLPVKPDRVTKRFKFFVRKAKLSGRERLKFHSLRHTTGSWLAMQGVPMPVIRDILGHSSTAVTEVYSHVSSSVAARAMDETFGDL